jgi:hypothetical protein
MSITFADRLLMPPGHYHVLVGLRSNEITYDLEGNATTNEWQSAKGYGVEVR